MNPKGYSHRLWSDHRFVLRRSRWALRVRIAGAYVSGRKRATRTTFCTQKSQNAYRRCLYSVLTMIPVKTADKYYANIFSHDFRATTLFSPRSIANPRNSEKRHLQWLGQGLVLQQLPGNRKQLPCPAASVQTYPIDHLPVLRIRRRTNTDCTDIYNTGDWRWSHDTAKESYRYFRPILCYKIMERDIRVINIVSKSFAVAVAIEKQRKTNMGVRIEDLRPYISDNGPQSIGPGTKPWSEISESCANQNR